MTMLSVTVEGLTKLISIECTQVENMTIPPVKIIEKFNWVTQVSCMNQTAPELKAI